MASSIFDTPLSTLAAQAKTSVLSNKKTSVLMAGIFVASFASMVSAAYTADHITKAAGWTASPKDANLDSAHKWATYTAVLSALGSLAAIGGIGYIILKDKKLY